MNKYEKVTLEQLNEWIGRNEVRISKLEEDMKDCGKRIARKTAKRDDFKHVAYMLTSYLESIEKLECEIAELKEAIVRKERVESGTGGIVEFLEYVLEKDVEWHEALVEDRKEKGSDAYRKMLAEEEITKTAYEFSKMSKEEALKAFKKDLDARYKKLVTQVTKKVGTIQEIEVRRNFNDGFDGYTKGEKGQCVLQTIIAGGWNVQRLHYRTMVK